MRRLFITITLIFITFYGIQAQETVVDLKAGYSVYNYSFTDEFGVRKFSESGLHVGVGADYEISEQFYASPELLFIMLFRNYQGEKYLQLPLFFKYYVFDKLYIKGGPQITYRLRRIYNSETTNFNIGVGAGLGYEFDENLYGSFTTLYQLNNYYTGEDPVIKRRANFFNIGFGFKFQ